LYHRQARGLALAPIRLAKTAPNMVISHQSLTEKKPNTQPGELPDVKNASNEILAAICACRGMLEKLEMPVIPRESYMAVAGSLSACRHLEISVSTLRRYIVLGILPPDNCVPFPIYPIFDSHCADPLLQKQPRRLCECPQCHRNPTQTTSSLNCRRWIPPGAC
jgi:hypothetical protein